jgi:hypothetical protein
MYRTKKINTGNNIAAIVHDPGIEPLFNGVNMNVLVEFLTSFYYTFHYLAILMLLNLQYEVLHAFTVQVEELLKLTSEHKNGHDLK